MAPFFSVIMPTYNRASFLNASINSVLDQSYSGWELIIIDDGSTDRTADLIASFDDQRIRYVYRENRGKAAARNYGISVSRGKYIAFLDSDDEYKKNHLAIHKQYIDRDNQPVALFFSLGSFRDKGVVTKDEHELLLEDLSFEICPMTLSITMHRSILKEEKFEESLVVREDAELWDRIRRKYPFVRIPEYTVLANYHDQNTRRDIFKYYNHLEYAITYYVKDRRSFSRQEYDKIIEVYKKLAFLHYQRNNITRSFLYLGKEMLIYPKCFFERAFWGLVRRNIRMLF